MNRNYYLRFFTPSPELTRRIVQANSELSEADAFENLSEADLAELDTDPEEDFEDEKFAGEGLLLEELEGEERERSLDDYQQFIAESLYSYLALLSRTDEAAVFPFDIYETIPHGMEENLGLAGAHGRYDHLLKRLAAEFYAQLQERHQGHCKTGWGEVRLAKEARLRRGGLMWLVARQAQPREERPRYRRAVLSPRASRAHGSHE